MNKILDHIQTHRDDYIQQLKGFLAIPSISALPDHAPDVRRCAQWCVAELKRASASISNVTIGPSVSTELPLARASNA